MEPFFCKNYATVHGLFIWEHAMSSPTAFGTLLRQLRKRAGMTQGDLAAAVGYSVSFICDLEQARRLPVLQTVVEQFVPALGLQDEPHFATRLLELAATAREQIATEG